MFDLITLGELNWDALFWLLFSHARGRQAIETFAIETFDVFIFSSENEPSFNLFS